MPRRAVLFLLLPLPLPLPLALARAGPLPLVVNTWAGPFTAATDAAFRVLSGDDGGGAASVLDAVQAGCAVCEAARCGGTVGFGGSPDEACETTLDALLMDGRSLAVGAVGALRRIRPASAVARAVLERTAHSLLAGDQATAFAVQHGFAEELLSTPASAAQCAAWRSAGCRPNFRLGHAPPSCPASPMSLLSSSPRGHDTLALVALDAAGHLAAGATTNGAAHKVPGRVGDAPIPGSGAYADDEAGGCGATGDGDIMMRFLPCYQAVESMRRGLAPRDAAREAVARMARRYPAVRAGLVVVGRDGEHAGAATGWEFAYAYRAGGMDAAEVVVVEPLSEAEHEL